MANEQTTTAHASAFPPVVGVLGHVDHGKTTLLDAIRKTSIADREFGGITQKIGTSSIEIIVEGTKRKITFIDTPGHEAFTNMRSRGAQAADIGLLIVSVTDGVMPQTKESIALLKQAQIPYIVVLTKVDLPDRNIEQTKQQLLGEEVLLEGLGGDVPVIEVSAKIGTNVKELLDLILLVQEMHPSSKKLAKTEPFEGIVIESKLDQKAGPKATIIVKNGMIAPREEAVCEGEIFRIRTLINEHAEHVKEASIGDGVEMFGMTKVPAVGSVITAKHHPLNAQALPEQAQGKLTKDMAYQERLKDDRLSIILVADTQGALEAIRYALPEKASIVTEKTGEVSEADILMAKSTGSIVLSFNSKIRPDVQKLAMTEKVLAKNYQIIYEMLDEIKDVLDGKAQALLEDIYGTAQVQAKFPFEKSFALGIKVMDGRVARGDKVRVLRGETVMGEATLTSLRVGKDTTSKVEKGHEAGVVLTPFLDFGVGDVLLCHS